MSVVAICGFKQKHRPRRYSSESAEAVARNSFDIARPRRGATASASKRKSTSLELDRRHTVEFFRVSARWRHRCLCDALGGVGSVVVGVPQRPPASGSPLAPPRAGVWAWLCCCRLVHQMLWCGRVVEDVSAAMLSALPAARAAHVLEACMLL